MAAAAGATWAIISGVKSNKVDASDSLLGGYDNLVQRLTEQVEANAIRIDSVKKEFIPDGNGSMRSAIDNLYTLVKAMAINTARQNAYIKALQNVDDMAIYEMDETGKLVFINSAFAELYGAQVSEILSGGWVKYIDSADLERINESGTFSQNNRSPWIERWTINRPNGVKVNVIGRGYPIVCADGEFHGFAGSINPDVEHPWTKVPSKLTTK